MDRLPTKPEFETIFLECDRLLAVLPQNHKLIQCDKVPVADEIDMPGHFSAAIKVYPELSCTGEAGWGEEFSYPICPSRPEIGRAHV